MYVVDKTAFVLIKIKDILKRRWEANSPFEKVLKHAFEHSTVKNPAHFTHLEAANAALLLTQVQLFPIKVISVL